MEAQCAQMAAREGERADIAGVLAGVERLEAAVMHAEHLGLPVKEGFEAIAGRADAAALWKIAAGGIVESNCEEAVRAAAKLYDRPLRWLKAVAEAQLAKLYADDWGPLKKAVASATLDSILAAADHAVTLGIPAEAALATAFARVDAPTIKDRALTELRRMQAERSSAEARDRPAVPLPERSLDPNESAVDSSSTPADPHRADPHREEDAEHLAVEGDAPADAPANRHHGRAERAAHERHRHPDPNERVVEAAGCGPSAVSASPSVLGPRWAAAAGDASESDVSAIRDAEAVLGARLTEGQRRVAARMVRQVREHAERARERAGAARRWPLLSSHRSLRRARTSRAPRRSVRRTSVAPARDGPPPEEAPPALATRHTLHGAAGCSAAPDVSREPSAVHGWVLPHGLGAEEPTLSAMLADGDVVRRIVAEPLPLEHFYGEAHGRIDGVLAKVLAPGHSVDIVRPVLHGGEHLAPVRGPRFLIQLAGVTPAVGHVEAHTRIVGVDGCVRQAITAQGDGDAGDADRFLDGSASLEGSGPQPRFTLRTADIRRGTSEPAPYFEDMPDDERVDPKVGLDAGRGDDVVSKAVRYVRERTLAGEPVRGIAALAKAIHVQRQRASAAVAHLAGEKLIVNEAEQVGRGRPKPRLWACSAAGFTRPPCARADAEPTSRNGAAAGTAVEPARETCCATMRAQQVPGADGDATHTRDVELDVRRVTMAKAASESSSRDVVQVFFENVPGNERVDLKAGVDVVYRADAQVEPAGRGNDVVTKAVRYVRERTLAGEPVRGIAALAKAIHVQRRRASATVAHLAREKLIVNEAEQVGRGRPKPRLWACSAADFTRPLRTEPKRGGAS
jgi:hypothetical protein